MRNRKRTVALIATGILAAGLAGGVAACQGRTESFEVGDRVDGQVVFQVNADGSFLTAPYVRCEHEDGSGADQVLPCVWDGDTRGNRSGVSYIMMPSDGDDPTPIYFD